jgi:hypothetical protein
MKALGWIAGIGFALAIVFLGLAFHTAGDSFSFAHQLVGQNPLAVGKGFREWAWSGGDKLTTDVPATITMTPGNPPTITVHGDNDVLRNLMFGDGKLVVTDRQRGKFKSKDMNMDMRGVALNEIDVVGTGEINLQHISQDKLTINVEGAGRLTADGHVGDLTLNVYGAGRARLGDLKADTMKVFLDGAGRADISPLNSADITIRGVGRASLKTKPKSLTSNISGYGKVVSAYDDGDNPPTPPTPPALPSPPR